MAYINFGVQAIGAVAGYQAEKSAVKARNKAKLANFDEANDRYLREVMFENAKWKNTVQDSQIAIDNMFEALTLRWQGEDLQFEAALDTHRYNKLDAQIKMYKEEYAGEQTGVTATRRASESIRSAGLAVTKSLQNAMLAKDKSVLAKEAARIEANQKRRAQWQSSWRSPVPGPTPAAPVLEAGPSMGGLMLNLAIAGATSYFSGKAQAKINKTNAQLSQWLKQNPPIPQITGPRNVSPITGLPLNQFQTYTTPIPGAKNMFALGSPGQTLKDRSTFASSITGTNLGLPSSNYFGNDSWYMGNPNMRDFLWRPEYDQTARFGEQIPYWAMETNAF